MTGPPVRTSPALARYETMADALLEAYRTGTPEAMERHYRYTWHRQAWDGVRAYVQLDLGKRPARPGEDVEITPDDARELCERGSSMLFMIIEHFRDGDPLPVYRRFRDRGRMAPPDVAYVVSWVSFDLARCYQVMEAPDRASIETWTDEWRDIVDFEIVPVITSEAAANAVADRL